MRYGNYFKFPENDQEILEIFEQAQILTASMIPIHATDDPVEFAREWRYLGNESTAYLPRDEQGDPDTPGTFYYESEELATHKCFLALGDEGDGCVTHYYVRKPF